jgi:hypothetical protein
MKDRNGSGDTVTITLSQKQHQTMLGLFDYLTTPWFHEEIRELRAAYIACLDLPTVDEMVGIIDSRGMKSEDYVHCIRSGDWTGTPFEDDPI